MSGKKKGLRQSNLFSFFGTPGSTTPSKQAVPASPASSTVASSSDVKQLSSAKENSPKQGQIKKEPQRSNTPQRSASKRKRVVISSDEEDVIFSCEDTSPVKRHHKREKIVLSDEEECSAEPSFSADILVDDCSRMSIEQKEPSEVLAGMNTQDAKVASKVMRAATLIKSLAPCEADFAESVVEAEKSTGAPGKKSLSSFSTSESDQQRFPHLYDKEFSFLKPDKLKDINGRKKTDPDYDPKTLYIPESFMKSQTPGHRQWWTIKSQHFDTVLFFKVGKFYELYHMDAVIGVECLNLIYMRGKFAHAGFPEMAYGRYADQLVSRGYKVARIEQTETPQQLEERCKASKVKDKVVKRELCRLTTQATRTYGVLDTANEKNSLDFVDSSAKYFVAISEKAGKSEISNIVTPEYGVCISDTSTGTFILSQFKDDECHSYLRTLLARHPPLQVVYEKGHSSSATQAILSSTVGHCQKDGLVPKTEFYTAAKTLEILSGDDYLGSDVSRWPYLLRNLLDDPEGGIAKCKDDFALAFSSLGATLWYLKRCLIDVDMITMRNFSLYNPLGTTNPEDSNDEQNFWKNRKMVLDCAALTNLNLVGPLDSRRNKTLRDPTAVKYSLYNTINKCSTAFGKRKLRVWVCSPLCDPVDIAERQDAVEFLTSAAAKTFVTESTEILRKVPDLERLLQKIHTLGLKYRTEKHPDGRAVMFDMLRYNKRKICDLVNTLDGFEGVYQIKKKYLQLRKEEGFKSVPLLEKCFGEDCCDIGVDLEHFDTMINKKRAMNDGIIVPRLGMDAEYDRTVERVTHCERNLDYHLASQRKMLNCSSIKYVGSGKARYTLEIPDDICSTLSGEYELKSQRKGYRRYMTPTTERLVAKLAEAEEERDKIRLDLLRRVFAEFDRRKNRWAAAMQNISTFDCLLSLSQYVKTSGMTMTRPEIVADPENVFLEVVEGYHPCLSLLMSSASKQEYIPNTTRMGSGSPLTILLTGPNMGGKSTLMRQVAVLVVLAQMGCLVPASSMKFTPVDRIFTRIGASDRIVAGQSTFFVELNETKTILRDATIHSLVVVDELGRGTSTNDGAAIASAVLKYIAGNLRCRCFFSTHYLALCSEVKSEPNVAFAHMACMVENECKDDPTIENVTFLYTVTEGICPKSYGFYAAKLAGIPSAVVRRAFEASGQYQVGLSRAAEALKSIRNLAMDPGTSRNELVDALRRL